jgi:hypothetical protein
MSSCSALKAGANANGMRNQARVEGMFDHAPHPLDFVPHGNRPPLGRDRGPLVGEVVGRAVAHWTGSAERFLDPTAHREK